jgi:malate synthase
MEKVRSAVGDEFFSQGRYEEARELFERVAVAPDFLDFLTLAAYELID